MGVLNAQEKAAVKLRALHRRKKDAAQQLEQREYLRHEIAARIHVEDLETIALILFSGTEAVLDADTDEIAMVPLDKERVAQLAAAASVKSGLLKKVLPDIKAVELTGAGGEELGTDRQMSELELKNRLRAVLTRQSVPSVLEHQPEEQVYEFLK